MNRKALYSIIGQYKAITILIDERVRRAGTK